MRQLAFEFTPAPPPTLDNFVPGRNAELLHHLRRLFDPGAGERFLYLWGAPGSGRSHLLRGAVARAAGTNVAYLACSVDTRVPQDAERLQCFAVDDVQRLEGEGQIALFDLYNALRERGGSLLASGDAPPARLGLRQDLVTRLAWGLVYQVHALSDEEKAQALKQQAAARGFALADEVCAYLLTRTRRDMSSLLALLDGLDRYSLQVKRPVTVALVRELLQAATSGNGDARPDSGDSGARDGD